KSRFSSQFVHLSILFTGERTSNHGMFMPCWGLEDLSESERVWGGLCMHAAHRHEGERDKNHFLHCVVV
ncbi:MAG: hypothetical protein IJ588_03925, partial [Prevotella sp.]|nr:hypothetical protein [Prevotella sp.]